MNALFIRLYLSTLAFLFIAFFLILFIANHFIYNTLLSDSSDSMEQVIVQALKEKQTSEWRHEVSTYNKLITDYTLSLVTQESLSARDQQQLLDTQNQHILSENKLGHADLYTLLPLPDSHWILKIDEDDSDTTPLNEWMDRAIIFIVLFATLAFALFLLLRKLTKPIHHLTQIAEKLGEGDWSARANKGLPPPMNTLAKGFNNMADQLNNTLQEQQVLIGAIPHELRSPLGKVRFALDMTRQTETLGALRQDIETIDGYVDEMQQTVDEILELNRLQNQPFVEQSPVNLCDLLEAIIEPHLKESPMIRFDLKCDPSMNASGHTPLLTRAIQNLLLNAIRFANSSIHITAWQENNLTLLRIDDDGAGIPEDKREQLFTPFTTLDSSRNRHTGGIGLGLSIVKIVMDKHNGHASISSNALGGARFELCW